MIVVTMTSWVKRIGFVKKVVESIENNTVKPDRIYLNLSKTEFDNAGVQLPKDLVEYFNSDERLIINWIDGENTKSMKKVFPILEYLEDNDIIIDADDDILFPSDLIESRLKDFEKYGGKYPITSNTSKCGIGDAIVVSPLSLFQKRMLINWDKYVNDVVLHTYNDDRTYLYILYLNGYIAKSSSKYGVKELNKIYGLHLDDTSMKTAKIYPIGRNYDRVVEPVVKKLTNTTIDKSFNFFGKKRYDCVMVYGKSGVDSQEMICGNYLEMEYVIASLKKYCSSWVGRIFIVGSEPPERVKKDVIHVPCDNPYTHCKDANIIHKLRYACENIQDLSDDFLMISDDQIVTKESSWEDMKPRIVRRFGDWTNEKWERNRKIDFWHECLYNTLNLFPKNKSCFWEPHIWSPINKQKFLEMCGKYDYEHNIECVVFSLYYNYIEQEVIGGFDHLHLNDSNAKRCIKSLILNNIPRHLSWADVAFSEKRFRDILNMIVGFKENSNDGGHTCENLNISVGLIQKIREGIKNGTIVKEIQPNGTHIWKKVRK